MWGPRVCLAIVANCALSAASHAAVQTIEFTGAVTSSANFGRPRRRRANPLPDSSRLTTPRLTPDRASGSMRSSAPRRPWGRSARSHFRTVQEVSSRLRTAQAAKRPPRRSIAAGAPALARPLASCYICATLGALSEHERKKGRSQKDQRARRQSGLFEAHCARRAR